MGVCACMCACVCGRDTVWPPGPKEHPCIFLQPPTPTLQSLPSLDFRSHPNCLSAAQSQGTGDLEMGVGWTTTLSLGSLKGSI